jgi:hypothetical protein
MKSSGSPPEASEKVSWEVVGAMSCSPVGPGFRPTMRALAQAAIALLWLAGPAAAAVGDLDSTFAGDLAIQL